MMVSVLLFSIVAQAEVPAAMAGEAVPPMYLGEAADVLNVSTFLSFKPCLLGESFHCKVRSCSSYTHMKPHPYKPESNSTMPMVI